MSCLSCIEFLEFITHLFIKCGEAASQCEVSALGSTDVYNYAPSAQL